MDNNAGIEEIEYIYTKGDAKKEFDAGNYPCSKDILEKLWESSIKNDPFLLFEYGKSLRKVDESIKFVEICRSLYNNQKIITNQYIVSTLCWCLYDCYIKNYNSEDKDNFNEFIKSAEYIKNNSEQKNANEHHLTPYVMTIRKVVKVYNNRASKKYNEIIKWLLYLSPDILSEEVFSFKDDGGKDRELASPKEFYYQHMAKALEKTEKYKDCIITCEKAFEQIKKFHYRNDKWIKARMYFSQCMVREDVDDAIKQYKDLAYRENHWFMYHKLSQICFRYNKIQDSLLYACKSFKCKFEHEKMVNLMLDVALLWQANGNQVYAKKFFHASAYYRNRQHWLIPEELRYAISEYEIDVEEKPNINTLKEISQNHVFNIEGKDVRIEGKVASILDHGGAGFIKPIEGGVNIYFATRDVVGRKVLTYDTKVEYEVSKDNKDRPVAIKIKVKG